MISETLLLKIQFRNLTIMACFDPCCTLLRKVTRFYLLKNAPRSPQSNIHQSLWRKREELNQSRSRRYYSGFKKSVWWAQKRARLYTERGGICGQCAVKTDTLHLTLHHIVPKSKGGRDVDANLILLCARCHGEKHKNGTKERWMDENTGS